MPTQSTLLTALAALARQKLAVAPPSPDLQQQAAAVMAPPGAPPPGVDPNAMPPPGMPPPGMPPPGVDPNAIPPGMPPPGMMPPGAPPPGVDPNAIPPPGMPPPGVDPNAIPPGALPPGADPNAGMVDPLSMPMGQLPAGLVLQLLTEAISQATGKKGDNQAKAQLQDLNTRLTSLESNVAALAGVAPPPAASAGQQPSMPMPPTPAAAAEPQKAASADRYGLNQMSPGMRARARALLRSRHLEA